MGIVARSPLLAALVLAGCAGTTAIGPGPSTAPTGSLPRVGPVPAPVGADADVELVSCDLLDGTARIEAIVTNRSSQAVLLQGVDVTLLDGDVVVEGADETSGLWSSVTIGPGRRTYVTGTEDLRRTVADLRCHLGPPDLRDTDDRPAGERLDPSLVTLDGCTDAGALRVANLTDRPIGVTVAVEFFDAEGFSAGRLQLGQWPTTSTDGRAPRPDEVALPPGATGTYPVAIEERVAAWGTPLTGPITSCEVVSAAFVVDPAPREVIVD